MMFLGRILFAGILLLGLPDCLLGQYSTNPEKNILNLPEVFILGEFENAYKNITPEYESLLKACENDMKAAFEKWLSMMLEMEAFSKQESYDLAGIRIWIHVFWNSNGKIEHLGYHLKPKSKYVNTDKLTEFFQEFMKDYQFPLLSDKKYAHYTAVSFPVFYRKINNSKTQNSPDKP